MAKRTLGPASMLIVQALRPHVDAALAAGKLITVGVSGGADSMALIAGLAWCRDAITRDGGQLWVQAVTIDHQLQIGSVQVARDVAQRVEAMGIQHRIETVQVQPRGGGIEAAAREARRAALLAASSPEGIIMLGHTLDDQAETVLLGLARGSGARSLSGMAPRTPIGTAEIVRPLLGIRRTDTLAACAEWGVQVWHDPHNQDDQFTRVKVRNRVMPMLEAELGPGVAEALARTAAQLRADHEFLDGLAQEALSEQMSNPETAPSLHVDEVAEWPSAIRDRIVHQWLQSFGVQPTSQHIGAVATLFDDWRGQLGIDLPGVRISRNQGLLIATRRDELSPER